MPLRSGWQALGQGRRPLNWARGWLRVTWGAELAQAGGRGRRWTRRTAPPRDATYLSPGNAPTFDRRAALIKAGRTICVAVWRRHERVAGCCAGTEPTSSPTIALEPAELCSFQPANEAAALHHHSWWRSGERTLLRGCARVINLSSYVFTTYLLLVNMPT